MKKISFSFKLLARPAELLFEHSKKVAELSLKRYQEYNHNLCEILGLNNEILEDLIYITGFSHDFGKATSYFQQYIKAEEEEKQKLKNHPETHHGLLSSIFTYWLIKSYLKIKNINSENSLLHFLPFFFFLMVKKHHGNLYDPINDELYSPQYDYLENQINKLDESEIENLLDFLSNRVRIKLTLFSFPFDVEKLISNEFRSRFKSTSIRRKFLQEFPENMDSYIIFQFFYSILLQSDKQAVSIKTGKKRRSIIDTDVVKNYKKLKFKKPMVEIDRIRESIFIDSHRTINKTDLNHKIFSLNVPTGCGKTLTALSVALRLRERLEKEKKFIPRIIYSLPFTSIIDQNYEVFREVLNNPGSELLLKHHHLSELFYKSEEDEEYDTKQSQFLIESWESEIIVTTFIQLFHTLLTNKNRALNKFHKLANAVILLDEVQTIPIKFWSLIRVILSKICDVFNSYIILMTATQPRIFSPKEMTELVPQKAKYFEKLNRVILSFHKEDLAIKDFNSLVLENISDSEESFLIVLNTINSSLSLYNFLLKNRINKKNIFYLSTNIIPNHRLQRIRKIKKIKNRKIIISTQLVEAGVDIDIENVWRDFGPLDSINQVCGRCNRNFKGKLGRAKIFQLTDETGNYFYKYIYGKSPLSILETIKSFKGRTTFNENEFLKNIDNYYKKIEKNMSTIDSEKIMDDVKKLRFDKVSQFKLIENDEYYKKDVFIEINGEAKEIWDKFIEIRKLEKFERKTKFREIRSNFYEYVISLPMKYIEKDEFEDSGIVYIQNHDVESYYDMQTGWKRENRSDELLIL
ncbi:MAG: CRISPR-associated helicase Cas3' [Candidatus Lokiarchaeota archaeon]|nr:CRISPR-associated helicase Cas3' [Candidatus Lokiarchaeota archaeon]